MAEVDLIFRHCDMNILVVLDHPDSNSFSHAIAKRFIDGAAKSGHSCELVDLHAEGFNPCWNMADIQNDGTSPAEDISKEHNRIDKCDAVCFVFPLFWFGMPAMMKGWIDRVWSWGWAYNQLDNHNKSLQKDRTAIMLIPAGVNPNAWQPYAEVEKSMLTIWKTGTLGYFGFKDKQIHFLNGSTGSDERRKELLERAYLAGLRVKYPK